MGNATITEVAPGVGEVRLGPLAERHQAALDDLVARYGRADHPDFLPRAPFAADVLPDDLAAALAAMRYRESPSVLVVRGGPVAEPAVPTPVHWRERPAAATVRQDFWLALVASRLGDPVCWSTLQGGRLFHDILPIAGEEHEQTGHGSADVLEFHVEDGFCDHRCDALALLCVRDRDGVASLVAAVDALDLGELDLEVLFEPRFLIRPDPEHLRGVDPASVPVPPRPVLFGDPAAPYLRVDPAYTDPLPGDERAARALEDLCARLAGAMVALPMSPGDLLLVDNYRAVHGRAAFRARYDGTDRWLRKVTVVRDLRRTGRRAEDDTRVLEPFAAVRG
ncbi:TauD/TfdA family dioxygenase [Saccharothrix obliqua]|uniref:TauD/TfdA family dioxygenase n=1 Tax=Saccharothrix obliqua TaxID=2861747 RepID=UPI001C5D4EE6|nr:TauD/TfdA family dioxygenase [Saccharothrix obliqua]MBW4720413.1 TauD/TfdA family dioxygenase [Saccharothrix obliqua]